MLSSTNSWWDLNWIFLQSISWRKCFLLQIIIRSFCSVPETLSCKNITGSLSNASIEVLLYYSPGLDSHKNLSAHLFSQEAQHLSGEYSHAITFLLANLADFLTALGLMLPTVRRSTISVIRPNLIEFTIIAEMKFRSIIIISVIGAKKEI